jgi:hypothetical protein
VSEPPDGAAAVCWHCMLREITIEWRRSAKYPRALAGYVHRAMVAGVFPRGGGTWEGKVWLAFNGGLPVESCESREDAQRWCLETVQLWFGQLDHI